MLIFSLILILFPGKYKIPMRAIGNETKGILWYIPGIVHLGIHYSLGETPLLVGFTNFDWDSENPIRWFSTPNIGLLTTYFNAE
jgi:hypothetical protein